MSGFCIRKLGVSPSTCLFIILLIHAPNLSQASDALALSFVMLDDGRATLSDAEDSTFFRPHSYSEPQRLFYDDADA